MAIFPLYFTRAIFPFVFYKGYRARARARARPNSLKRRQKIKLFETPLEIVFFETPTENNDFRKIENFDPGKKCFGKWEFY